MFRIPSAVGPNISTAEKTAGCIAGVEKKKKKVFKIGVEIFGNQFYGIPRRTRLENRGNPVYPVYSLGILLPSGKIAIIFFFFFWISRAKTHLDVQEQRHSEWRRHGHNLFRGQTVEVDDDHHAADLCLFFDQRGHLDQIEDFEQLFAGEFFRVPSR